ncbi:NAD(P)-binding protein [Cantharellus anzutake]|uniref:NAD(P)-binding protein n=1 Tax=Cantharellus anzutake TaxID=1750568 RepID=UPI0019058CFC|nr:NAD(P)-binding protein [Cantharellus anzutake]KAF8341271.1 NAD(P)-binding protein [Cantharellus anzutake]
MSFGLRTTGAEAALKLQDHIRGKNVLITGVTQGGLGGETARVLSPYVNLLILVGRNPDKLQETLQVIKGETPSVNVQTVSIDLSSLQSIRRGALEIAHPIHVLINNAAIVPTTELTRTKDGFESQFGTNHLGHFYLTSLLLPRILSAVSASYSPRVVNVSSAAIHDPRVGSNIRLDDPNYILRPEEYQRMISYSVSKVANTLHAREIAKRYKSDGILAFSLHPGGVWTNLVNNSPVDLRQELGLIDENGKVLQPERFKSIAEGTSTHIVAAFDPLIKEYSGAYLCDCRVTAWNDLPACLNEDNALKLWMLSEELTSKGSIEIDA